MNISPREPQAAKRQALRLMLQGRIDAYLAMLTRKLPAHGAPRG